MRKVTNNDPRPLRVKYACTCKKCGIRLPVGVNAYYWPSSREILCLDCGHSGFMAFLSSVADEEAYCGTGNPFC